MILNKYTKLIFLLLLGLNLMYAAENEECKKIGMISDYNQLDYLFKQSNGNLVLINNSVYSCSCDSRQFGGDNEAREHGGRGEGIRELGGDTEAREHGGRGEGTRELGGDTEAREHGGRGEGTRELGGDTEARSISGNVGEYTCSYSPSCTGYVLNTYSGNKLEYFDGQNVYKAINNCIP